jgi:uncharacterized RDD family membrane protein YckC
MSETPEAVVFHADDYAGTPRRLAAAVTDLAVVVLLLAGLSAVAGLAVVPADVRRMATSPEKQRRVREYLRPVQSPVLLGWLAVGVAYHVALWRLPGGTLGYRLTRQRLVDAAGQPPRGRAVWRRFLLAIPFVLFFGLAYLPCRRSARRQAIHDLWSGTWVVRAGATPAGPARIIYQTKLFGLRPLIYPALEPVHPPQSAPEAPTPHEPSA